MLLLRIVFLHTKILVSKTLFPDLQKVLNQVVRMFNFIKSRPYRIVCFRNFVKTWTPIIFRTIPKFDASLEAKFWRVCSKLRIDCLFCRDENQHEFCKLLRDINWISKFAYLVDVFSFLNKVNTSMQGKGENLLTSADKINYLKKEN